MAQVVTVKGVSFMNKAGAYKFAVRDSTQSWFSSSETLSIEAPEVFDHIKQKLGRMPTSMKIQIEFRILD